MLDPKVPSSFNHRFINIPRNDHRYHLVDEIPTHYVGPISECPTVLLLHGFPDLWYGWRYQIIDLKARGFRVIAIDCLGFGETSQPIGLDKYGYKSLSYDLNSLLNEMGIYGNVMIGCHDFGGMLGFRFADYFPHRVKAIVSVCTPYPQPAQKGMKLIDPEVLLRKYLPNFGYQIYFMSEKATEMDEVVDIFLQPMFSPTFRRMKAKPEYAKMSTWVLIGNLERSIGNQIIARRAGKLPGIPREPEMDYYVDQYIKSGLKGPLNGYKTRKVNFEDESASNLPKFPAHIPVLQLAASLDAALPVSMAKSKVVMDCFPGNNLEVRVLEGADHWCLQDEEKRGEVTRIIGDWMEEVVAGKWRAAAIGSKL